MLSYRTIKRKLNETWHELNCKLYMEQYVLTRIKKTNQSILVVILLFTTHAQHPPTTSDNLQLITSKRIKENCSTLFAMGVVTRAPVHVRSLDCIWRKFNRVLVSLRPVPFLGTGTIQFSSQ